jgi:mevalonate kinase
MAHRTRRVSRSTASAPGKIILFGEHAVVYGRPALAVPVTQVHADVEVTDADSAGIWINAPDVNLYAELNTLPPTIQLLPLFITFSSSHAFPRSHPSI